MHTCARTHKNTRYYHLHLPFSDLLLPKQAAIMCVCTLRLSWASLIRSTLKANNHKPGGLENDSGWGKEKMCIHPQRILAMCGFVFTAVSAFFRHDTVCVSEFVVWIQLSDWCVKSLTASLWLVRTGRQHYPGRGKKRTEMQDRPGLLLGRPTSVQWLVKARARKRGTAAVSFNEPLLRSSAFNLQSCPALLLPIPSFHTNPCNKHKSRLVSCMWFPRVVYNS